VNGPIVHGKAAIVAIKPSSIIEINEPVFPRMLGFSKDADTMFGKR
jgi:hypothetical protein